MGKRAQDFEHKAETTRKHVLSGIPAILVALAAGFFGGWIFAHDGQIKHPHMDKVVHRCANERLYEGSW